MALKHTFVSGKTDGGDATLVQPSNWNADHVVDASGVLFVSNGTNPSAPAAGYMTLYGEMLGTLSVPAYIGPTGGGAALQSFLGQKKIALFLPINTSTTTNGALIGITNSTLGTAAARTAANTSFFAAMTRIGYASVATVSNRAGFYTTNNYWRGNVAGAGGFKVSLRFGISDAAAVANANMFVGLVASSAVMSGGTNPSASFNLVGVGCDAAETTLSIMSNDGSGAATKVSLGANFPCNTRNTDAYELILCAAPNGSEIGYQVTRLNTGNVASGTITTKLPASNQFLMAGFFRGNMSTALAVSIDVMGLYSETES